MSCHNLSIQGNVHTTRASSRASVRLPIVRRAAALAQCRALLAQPAPPVVPPESVRALMLRVTGIDIERCPVCQQGLLRRLDLLAPTPAPWDTS